MLEDINDENFDYVYDKVRQRLNVRVLREAFLYRVLVDDVEVFQGPRIKSIITLLSGMYYALDAKRLDT